MNSHALNARYPCSLCIPVTVKMTVRVVVLWVSRGCRVVTYRKK